MSRCRGAFCASLFSLAIIAHPLAHAAPALGTYNIDTEQISVSGMSSGGYMAVQMQVAFSASVMGVGVLAAGPYLCAEGSVANATTRCLNSMIAFLPPASYFRDLTLDEAAAGRIDSTSSMAGDRVWIFTGGADDVVLSPVVDSLKEYYEFFTDPADIVYLRDRIPDAQHAMITDDHGNACGFKGGAFINDCNFDAVGMLLQHIYGPLNAPVAAPNSSLKTFDQSAFRTTSSLGTEGYIYVPTDCEDKSTACRLHVAFHGCEQNKDEIGDEFARHAGYNEWAEANDIVVLYPQTGPSAVNECWDWWGYTDADLAHNYHTQSGIQMAAVKAMIERVAGTERPTYCGTDSNSMHVTAGRAYTQIGWWFWEYYYATGSDDYLGFLGSTSTTLQEVRPGYFATVSSCP
jgi:poly(3-hydroxybutyrate) depolymerase